MNLLPEHKAKLNEVLQRINQATSQDMNVLTGSTNTLDSALLALRRAAHAVSEAANNGELNKELLAKLTSELKTVSVVSGNDFADISVAKSDQDIYSAIDEIQDSIDS